MRLVAIVASVGALFTSSSALAQPVGRVTLLDGQATVLRGQVSAVLNFKSDVFLSDRIATGEKSLLRLLVGRKAYITMRELSALAIWEEPGKAVIGLANGKIAYDLLQDKMQPGEIHEIRTPNAIVQVLGTTVIVETEQNSAQSLGAGPSPWTTYIDVLRPSLPGQSASTVLVGSVGGPLIVIPAGQGLTITGRQQEPLRPSRPNVMSGLEKRARRSQ